MQKKAQALRGRSKSVARKPPPYLLGPKSCKPKPCSKILQPQGHQDAFSVSVSL